MAHPVDIHVGKRIRQRRWMVGITQAQLAAAVGIKFQQIQKYETGANRVSASRLWEIAQALKMPVADFFDEMDGSAEEGGRSDLRQPLKDDRQAQELVRCYQALPENQRLRLLDLARVLSDAAA